MVLGPCTGDAGLLGASYLHGPRTGPGEPCRAGWAGRSRPPPPGSEFLQARLLPRPAAADPRFRGRPAAPAHPEPFDDPRAEALRRPQAAGGEPSQRRHQATSASPAFRPDRTGLLRPGTAGPGDVVAIRSRVGATSALLRPGGRPANRPGPCTIPGPVPRGREAWRSLETLLSRPALVLLRTARVLQGPRDRDACPAVRPRHLADRRRWAVASAAGTARGAAGSQGPGPFPGEDIPRRGPHRPPPGRGRLLVPLERTQRGVRASAGRGHGERLPGDQHCDPAQRRALGEPP